MKCIFTKCTLPACLLSFAIFFSLFFKRMKLIIPIFQSFSYPVRFEISKPKYFRILSTLSGTLFVTMHHWSTTHLTFLFPPSLCHGVATVALNRYNICNIDNAVALSTLCISLIFLVVPLRRVGQLYRWPPLTNWLLHTFDIVFFCRFSLGKASKTHN